MAKKVTYDLDEHEDGVKINIVTDDNLPSIAIIEAMFASSPKNPSRRAKQHIKIDKATAPKLILALQEFISN